MINREEENYIINPARGWYRIYTFNLDNQDIDALNWLEVCDSETLALLLIDIGAYRDMPIEDSAIDYLCKIFDRFIQLKKEIILRIVYDTEGKGMIKEPSTLSQILFHMKQLGSVIKNYANLIYVSQGLFVGNWGEMHGSKFLSEKDLKVLAKAWYSETQGMIRIALRKPVQCRIATYSSDMHLKKVNDIIPTSDICFGVFDDAILASYTHLGTFGETENEDRQEMPWCPAKEFEFIKNTALKVPCGGEAVAGNIIPTCEEIINTLKKMNVSYLNCIHDTQMLNEWKKQEYLGESLYSYISSHLGYHIVVEEIKTAHFGIGKKGLKIKLANTGFARFYDKAELRLIIKEGENNIKEEILLFDIRTLGGGETIWINANTGKIKKGAEVLFRMVRKKDNREIKVILRKEFIV